MCAVATTRTFIIKLGTLGVERRSGVASRAMATFSRRAVAVWTGEVARGTGTVTAGTDAFAVAMAFPRLGGEPPNTTTPEELLAASHANCYAIALRSVLGQRRGTAQRVSVTATITAEKGAGAIRVLSSHLEAVVEGLKGVEPDQVNEVALAAEAACTISNAIRGAVAITVNVAAS
jgi:osmotically inducible protein OsmC